VVIGDRDRDEKGRFVAKQEELKLEAEPAKPAPEAPKPAAAPLPEAPKTETKPAAPAPEYRPPQSWKPAARELWKEVPALAQAEITRLENETKRVMRESSEARQGYEQFKAAVAPYELMIRSEGGDPIRAVQSLLQTAAALRTAPPLMRAELIANLVKRYLPGKEGIELLDRSIAGEAPPGPSSYSPGQYQDPRVDELMAKIREAEQQREIAASEKAKALLADLENEEFFEDVQDDMADLLEAAKRRGVAMTPREAYNRALMVNPDVAKVLEQREAARRAASQDGPTQRARAAASSVKTTPAPGVRASQQNGTLRDDLEDVVRELGSNRSV
jgi:hypothetical protein